MENQNGTTKKPLIKQHSHARQSSQEDFFSDSEGNFSKSSGYDPKRIPSSIFSTRSATPMEWSVASNESLFSIHPGNSSFSKENVLLHKSGELAKVEDQPGKSFKPDEPSKVSKPDETVKAPPRLPPVAKLADNMERILEIDEVNNNNNNQQKFSPADTRSERSSSATSVKSFQFQVLESDTGRYTSVKREIMEEMENRRHKSLKKESLQEEKEKRPLTWHSQQQSQSSERPCHSDQSQEPPPSQPESQTPTKAPKFGSNNTSSWFSCIPCLSPCTSK